MSKDYVMQLEATIQNLRRDNLILKELNAKYKNLEEQLGCPLEVVVKAIRDGIYGFHKIYDGARTEEIEVFEHFEVSFDGYSLWNETHYEYNRDEIFKISPILNEISLYDYKKTWWLKENHEE